MIYIPTNSINSDAIFDLDNKYNNMLWYLYLCILWYQQQCAGQIDAAL